MRKARRIGEKRRKMRAMVYSGRRAKEIDLL